MTKVEIVEWVKSAKYIITDYNEINSNGNHYARDIFKSEGLYWALEYINGVMIPARKVLKSDVDKDLPQEHQYQPRQVKQERDLKYHYV